MTYYISLHSAMPGPSGTDYELSYTNYRRGAVSFDATGLNLNTVTFGRYTDPGETAIWYCSLWEDQRFVSAIPFSYSYAVTAGTDLNILPGALQVEPEMIASPQDKAGAICKRCNAKNEWAAPSQSYICFECR